MDVLKAHCDAEGRDYAEIEKTTLGVIRDEAGDLKPAALVAGCRELAGIGVDQALFSLPSLDDLAAIEKIGREVIPEVAAD